LQCCGSSIEVVL